MECLICCESFSTKRKEIKCPYCSKGACVSCHMEFFMNSTEPAHCIYKCDESMVEKEHTNEEGTVVMDRIYKKWNIKYLSDNFPNSFIWGQGTNAKGAGPKTKKSYRQHREEILLDQQLALMNATQPIVIREQKIKQLVADKKVVLKKIKTREKNLSSSKIRETWYERNARFDKVNNELTVLYNERKIMIIELRILKNGDNSKTKKEEKIINRGHCPKCPGFISEGWKCGLCQTKICSKCRETITQKQLEAHQETLKMRKKGQEWIAKSGHACDKSTLETIKHLKESNYRNCPGCKIPIERSMGCSQMFCTQCNIFFDWRSGKQIKKTQFIHNPHYQEWLDQGGRENGLAIQAQQQRLGDCDVNEYTVNHLLLREKHKEVICSIIRYINEIRDQVNVDNDPQNGTMVKLDNSLLELRKRYLRGTYGKVIDKAKKQLGIHTQRAYKRESKTNETIEVRDMFADACLQIFAKMIIDIKHNKNFNEQQQETKSEGIVNKISKFINTFFNYKLITSEIYSIEKRLNEEKAIESLTQIVNIYKYTIQNMNELGKRYNSGVPPLNKWERDDTGRINTPEFLRVSLKE